MQALFAKLERVALSDVIVDWPDAVELYPPEVPDVYAGEPLVLAASYPATPDRPLLTTAFGRGRVKTGFRVDSQSLFPNAARAEKAANS
jgi:hypothetical protein